MLTDTVRDNGIARVRMCEAEERACIWIGREGGRLNTRKGEGGDREKSVG